MPPMNAFSYFVWTWMVETLTQNLLDYAIICSEKFDAVFISIILLTLQQRSIIILKIRSFLRKKRAAALSNHRSIVLPLIQRNHPYGYLCCRFRPSCACGLLPPEQRRQCQPLLPDQQCSVQIRYPSSCCS